MPQVPPGGDRLIINTDYVHSVGAQVKTDAQNLLGPGQHSASRLAPYISSRYRRRSQFVTAFSYSLTSQRRVVAKCSTKSAPR